MLNLKPWRSSRVISNGPDQQKI